MGLTAFPGLKNWRDFMPAFFLVLAVALDGLRTFQGWTVFSVFFIAYLVLRAREISFMDSLPAFLLACWTGLGLFFSPEPLNSFWYFSHYLVFIAFFCLARTGGSAARTAWIWAVFALAFAASLTLLFEFLTGRGLAGLIGPNPNYSSALMAAGLAGALAAGGVIRGRTARLALVAGIALCAAGMLVVNSRGALLAALIAVIFLLWMKNRRRQIVYLLGTLAIIWALAPAEYCAWFLKTGDPRSLERLNIWNTAVAAIFRHPVFGSGLGLFEQIFEVLKFPFYNGISYYGHSTPHAHSELLNLAAEAGLPAAMIFIWMWGAGVSGGTSREPEAGILKIFAVTLFAQSAVDMVFYSGAVQLCFFGTLGLLASGKAEGNAATTPGRKAAYLLAAAVAAAAALKYGFERDKACAQSPAAGAARASCVKRALEFSPGDAQLLKIRLESELGGAGNYARAAAFAEDAALKYPKDPFFAAGAAQAYYVAGDRTRAGEKLSEALALEPGFLYARFGLARILVEEGQTKRAAAELEKIGKIADKMPSALTAYDSALIRLPMADYVKARNEIWKKK